MWPACVIATLVLAQAPPVTRAPKAKKSTPVKPKASQERPFPIESLVVRGSKFYEERAIVPMLELRVGQVLVDKELDAARDRLIALGAFSRVGYRYEPAPSGQGYAVTFEVVDYEQVIPYRFERLEVDAANLRAKLREKDPLFGEKIPTNQVVLDRFRGHVQSAVGKPVQVRVTSDAQGQLAAVFLPAGSLPTVAEVYFTGTQVVPASVLQKSVHGTAVGVEFHEQRFREILDASVRPVYEARGRLLVSFPKIETEPARGVRGVVVRVTVEEGPSFSIGEVTVEGIESGPELAKTSGVKNGDVANMDMVRQGQERIHAALRRGGFLNVNSKINREIKEKEKLCDIVYSVETGPQFQFGRLMTKGLDLDGEHEVKRLWGMKPGQVFNADYPDFFLGKLREEGVFDNLQSARAVLAANEKTQTVDVTLVFNEKPIGPATPGKK